MKLRRFDPCERDMYSSVFAYFENYFVKISVPKCSGT